MIEELLKSNKYFKLVCGAGNEDTSAIEKLMKIYYEAGCKVFDLCMSEEVGKIASKTCPDAILCFSYGIKDDPHTVAISDCTIDEKKCIGCKQCISVCPNNAIETYSKTRDLKEVLPAILKYNPQCIELHACSDNEEEVEQNWRYIESKYDGMMSLCIDRSILGDKKVISRIKKLIKNRKPFSTIIQADGNPMSGGINDYKTTLQAVAMAEVIQKNNLPVYVVLSGGTNSKTKELSNLCDININGVAIGSFARKIVKKYVEQDNLLEDTKSFNEAVEIAKKLINSTY